MGERVYVGRRQPPGTDPFVEARTEVPLDYHQPTAADRWRRIDGLVRRLGGYRQVGFAIGVGLVLSGAGAALRSDAAAFLGFAGGVLIGLCVQIPRWRDD